jgi:nicotinate dehydrogenase subunit B
VKLRTEERERLDSIQSPGQLALAEAPDAIDIVLLDRPDLPPSGAGEGSIRPVAAAIGNAIFDAIGVRIRRAPFTPERVKAAIG